MALQDLPQGLPQDQPVQPRSEDDSAARTLLDAAGAALARQKLKVPATFLPALYGRAVPEDLARYQADELARLAADAWSFLAERTAGEPKVRFVPAAGVPDVAVLETVNDDMPFLVDSIMGDLNERGIDIRLVAHPVFAIERNAAGQLTSWQTARPAGGKRESFIHIHVAGHPDAARRSEILAAVERVLADVRVCVQDWRPMLTRVGAIIADLKATPPPLPVDEIAEAVQFLEWLMADNFTFLGVREYRFTPGEDALDPVIETALGLLRSEDVRLLRRGNDLVTVTPEIREFLNEPQLLIVAKAAVRSRVHRRVYMDYIGIKRYDGDGKLVGEIRICGLFTSTAYTRSTRSIPYLRRKLDHIVRRAGFDPEGHSGKALVNVLETYPRDELFQIDEDTLYGFALAILQLDERPRVRVLPRRDRFDRFVSVIVFVPREGYDSRIRVQIGEYLAATYQGHVSAFHPYFPDGPLVRIHFIIGRREGETPNPDRATLEQAIAAIVRTWVDGLSEALVSARDPNSARVLFSRYRDAFPIDYREVYTPTTAVDDIRMIETLTPERPLGVDFYREQGEGTACGGLKVWSHGRPIPLSERVPVLENMGFRVVDERTYHLHPGGASEVWFHDMSIERADGGTLDLDDAGSRLETAFVVTMRGTTENDGYNALVLVGGMLWRDVALIRTISRFLRQIRVPYSQDYMWTTLRKHAAIAARIVELFHTRFDPHIDDGENDRKTREAEIAVSIETALNAVASLDEDRILRHFVAAVRAAIRTNYYQLGRDGRPRELIAIKFASREIEDMPRPRPLYEIFVYSPRVEGVHMRFGKVARGGIRWSDRPQDFRTEVLGLVKAQQVKNAVIVPVGAKGGFVPQRLPAGGARDALQAEGVATYKEFISTLLDITDNIGVGKQGVIPPADVVRHEGDDPYLVVAADKGTATFSDIANAISEEHKYWLGDAFASGGSAGYDHKKMGITARGAWESVKRHFREMDVDIGKTSFTCAGVGDMSGDVFGNGLLREKTTRLVAAFDHRDIFIDPDPDPEKTFAERQRLFDLPRSSWQDFDKKLISKGGGVYPRSAKEIALSPEARKLFSLPEKATPHEVMRAILKAPVDLLFFGGIGTYVRAATETDESVGDRANDPLRVTGSQLRCKVIGEGANLGMTQHGRIEAALRGVRLNTDAIDNSAGVNTSDVEVNIKIALSIPVRDGRLTMPARNALLGEMTGEVAALVLRNNYLQTLALSLAQRRGMEDFGFLQRLIQSLETRGLLDRAVEFLPDDVELAERRRRSQAFTRPELAVLLAYAKLSLFDDLLESSVPDEPYLARELGRYFPHAITERFPDALEQHRLRREIIATHLGNSMINRGGPSLVVRIADQTGANAARIAYAFTAVRDSYGMTDLNAAIDALDNKVPGKLQLELYAAVQDLLLDRIVWGLRNVDRSRGLAENVKHYRAGIAAVETALDAALPKDTQDARAARQAELQEAGVPEELARKLANLGPLTAAPDIVLVAERTGKGVAEVAATFFATGAFFRLDRIAAAAAEIKVEDYFDRLALDRARDSIGDAERRLTAAVLADGTAGAAAVEAWIAPRKAEVERIRSAIQEIAASGMTLSKLSVAASLLGDLVKN